METVASNLAEHLKTRLTALRSPRQTWSVQECKVSHAGDLVEMLQLPAGQQLYLPEMVRIHRVVEPLHGATWQPSPESDVLLLGDSFSNIYTTPDLGWGEAAGFPAQLSRFLGRSRRDCPQWFRRLGDPARACAAARPTRGQGPRGLGVRSPRIDAGELGGGADARSSCRSCGSPINSDSERAGLPSRPRSDGRVDFAVPAPFSVPYKDCLTYVKLRVDRVVDGTCHDAHVVAVFWGMKDNVRLPAADHAARNATLVKACANAESPRQPADGANSRRPG